MTARSVLDIDINDEQFQDFFKQFQEYEKLLASLPDEWDAVNKSLSGAAETFAASAASVETIAESMRGATVAQDRFHAAAQRSDRTMGSLASHARSAAHAIGSVAKWAGLGGTIGGGLAMFGMDRLAHSIFGQSFSARGLGVSTGEQSALGINFRAFTDPGSLLGNVANARNDLTARWAFSGLGIGADQMAGLDNADLARLVMSRARDKWRHWSAKPAICAGDGADAVLLYGGFAPPRRDVGSAVAAGQCRVWGGPHRPCHPGGYAAQVG